MKKIYSFLVLFVLCFSAKSQVDFTIGTATGANTTSSYPCPIQDFYEGSRQQFLYTAAEMQAAGMSAGFINSIKFNATSVTAPTGSNFPNVEQFSVSIGSTATTSLDATTWESGTTPVWGPLDYTIVVGVNEFIFTTPFFWNGTDNIVVDVCNGDPGNTTYTAWTNNAIFPWTDNLGFNGSHSYRADNLGNLCGTSTVTQTGTQTTRPDITFNWISPTPCSGAPTGGITVSTKDSVCPHIPFSVYVTGGTSSAGMKYQWDSSLNGTTFYPMAGDTNFSYGVKSGITVNTWYRRHTTCVSSALSAISTPTMVFVRPFYECYCGPLVNQGLHTTSTSPTIDEVAIVGGTLNYSNQSPGSSSDPYTGWIEFTDTTATTNPPIPIVRQASSYTMTVTTSVSPTTNAVAYWVDWNHNGIYDSAEFNIVPFVTGNLSGDVSFDVPANAPLGLTMMRIRTTTFGIIYSNPCTNFFNGETEDYIFKVLPGIACTGTPLGGTAVTVDSICPGKPFTVSVDFTTTTTGVTNLKYQWQDSSALHSWQNTSIADTNKTYTNAAGITIPTWYRRKITCTTSNSSSLSTSVTLVIKSKVYCFCSPLNGVAIHSAAGSPTISEVDIVGNITNVTHQPALSKDGLGYSLYDDTTLIGCLTQANTYSLTVQTNVKPNQGGIWVDWNGNNLMDLNEYTPLVLTGTSAPYLCTADITVPQNAVLGLNVLRIRVRAATFTNSCDQFGSGQTVDYAFIICPGIPCTGKPLGGIAVASVASICPNVPFDVKDSAGTDGVTNLHYQWQYSTTGSSPWLNNPNGTVDTTRNLTVSQGITVATWYRRIITCTLSNQTDTSVATQVTMNSLFDCYCGPNNGTTLHSSTGPTIDQVDINGCSLSYSNSSPGAATGGYSVFYDSILLSRAVSYTMTITASAKPTFAGVWIDWNHSGSFDATEYQQVTFATGSTTADVIITPDVNALLGTTLMRVRFGTFTSTNACTNYFGGETEDYVIKITAGSPCAGTPIGGAAAASVVSTCNGIPFNLNTTGTSDCNLGLVYQWQDSSSAHNWQNISGQTSALATGVTQNIAAYYRRKITCTNTSAFSYSTSVFVDQFAVSYATLPFTEDFENTWDDGCGASGSHTIPNNYWRSYPLMGDSSWRRNDDGASANWIAATSASYTPTASTGTYSARFHTYEASSGTSGNLDLFLNCTSIAPTKNLTFDFINNDGSDSVQVLLSTDGGTTFSRIGGVKTASAWTTKSIDFNSTSATTVIRFRATSDFGFTDFGIDNVNVVSIINVDAAATAVVAPTGSFAATSTGTITVSITNAGVSTIDFATNPANVGASVTGPSGGAPIAYTKVVNTGTLAVGASMNVTITTNANFSAAGTYCIKGGVSCLNDGNPSNDSTAVNCVNAAGIPLYAIANGNWGDGSTWSTGSVPTIGDTATITGFTVTLGGAAASPYNCGSLGMGAGGSLIAPASKTLNIGSSSVANKSITFAPTSTLNISGGTVNVNGFVLFNDSSNFIMSAGNLNLDANNGTDGGSVPSGVDILGFGTALKNYSFGTINLTGGTIKVVDPHRFNGNAIGYRGSVARTIDPANTIVLGDAVSTNTCTTGNGGFVINTSAGSAKLYLGSLTIGGGNTVGNRYTTSANTLGIGGDLTINTNSDFRVTFPTYYAGNITNNGTFASGAIFSLQSYANGVAGVVNNTQTISGTGVFRNNIANISITAPGASYAVGDILTLQGGTFVSPAKVYVTSVGGTGNITGTTILSMGNYSVAPTGAISVTGGTGTGATLSAVNSVSAAQFASLTINNKSAGGVNITSLGTLLSGQTGTVSGATGNLTLIAGIINNTPTITLGSSITQRGNLVYTSGLFTGKFSRWFNAATNTGTTGDFPVGKTTYPQTARVEFTTATTTGGTLTAEFIAAAPGYGGIPLMDGTTQIVNMANDAYWRIDANSITGGNYTLTLTDSGIVNAMIVPTLVTLKRPSNTTIWGVDGTQGTNTGSTTKPTVVRTGLSGFSEFAIAGAIDNPLPVSAVKLIGGKVGNTNQLSWTAINETEVKGYDLQRSTDGTNFNAIAFVLSKENGVVAPKLDYTYSDNNSISTDGYYRLKQIAKDGTTLFSNIVLIKGSKVTGIVVGNVYPNPVKTSLNVVVASSNNKQVIVKITDMSGKQIMTTNYALTKGDNDLKVNLGNIAAGTYAVTVLDADGTKSNVATFVKE